MLVAGAVTLEICVLIGLPLNFANIVALPLLLGIGVAFKIYYVVAWRSGRTNLLQTSLTRAIVSARSGETEDTTVVHLAVGWNAGQLKVGSFARSERMAKWNEALRIEEALGPRARLARRFASGP